MPLSHPLKPPKDAEASEQRVTYQFHKHHQPRYLASVVSLSNLTNDGCG